MQTILDIYILLWQVYYNRNKYFMEIMLLSWVKKKYVRFLDEGWNKANFPTIKTLMCGLKTGFD